MPEVSFADLTAVERDFLYAIRAVETEEGRAPTTKEIVEVMEVDPAFGRSIRSSHAYGKLADLDEKGLVETVDVDGRTKARRTTEYARQMLALRVEHETSWTSADRARTDGGERGEAN